MFGLTFLPFVFEKVRGLVIGKVKTKVEERAKRWWYGPLIEKDDESEPPPAPMFINYNGQSHVFSDL